MQSTIGQSLQGIVIVNVLALIFGGIMSLSDFDGVDEIIAVVIVFIYFGLSYAVVGNIPANEYAPLGEKALGYIAVASPFWALIVVGIAISSF
jgi:hypothetical protein